MASEPILPLSRHLSNLISPPTPLIVATWRCAMIYSARTARMAAPAFALAATVILADGADAASPGYCALYAREYAVARIASDAGDNALSARQRLEDQAFTRCLNLDVEPEFPATSVYYGASAEDVAGAVAEGDANPGDLTPVDPTPAPKPQSKRQVVASNAPVPPAGISRVDLKIGTDAWRNWCASHYPNSFDPTTGTVLPFDSQKREVCRP
jgi:hypothetical protein